MSQKKNGKELQSLIKQHALLIDELKLEKQQHDKVLSIFSDFADNLKNTLSVTTKNEVKSENQASETIQNIDSSTNSYTDKYKGIANSISDIFFMLDNELNFTFITPSIEQILEYQFTELVGKGFDILVPQWSGNTLKKNLDNLKRTKPNTSEPYKFTIQLSGKYGNLKWYEVQITGVFNQFNDLKGYNGICRDITERLKYEEALRQAKRKAEDSDKLKSVFLANMSHEIRTPLNGIIGFSTMLDQKNLPQEKKEKYTKYIVSSSRLLLSLINDIIDISKIEAGQLNIFRTQVDLKKIFDELNEIIEVERERLDRNDVDIIQNLPDNKSFIIDTDEIRLKQVLFNLLSNALKFTGKGQIVYGYNIGENKINFFVKDTGTGIPHSIQRAIFERFRQGNIDHNEKISGTGLGLAISKGIVELLGGKIGVISEENVGSEFYFEIPINF